MEGKRCDVGRVALEGSNLSASRLRRGVSIRSPDETRRAREQRSTDRRCVRRVLNVVEPAARKSRAESRQYQPTEQQLSVGAVPDERVAGGGEDLLVGRDGEPGDLLLLVRREAVAEVSAELRLELQTTPSTPTSSSPGQTRPIAEQGGQRQQGGGRTESAFWIVRPQMPDQASQNLIVWSSGWSVEVHGQC